MPRQPVWPLRLALILGEEEQQPAKTNAQEAPKQQPATTNELAERERPSATTYELAEREQHHAKTNELEAQASTIATVLGYQHVPHQVDHRRHHVPSASQP